MAIDGTIDADGLAILTATGRTFRAEHNIAAMKDAAAGTLYHYSINAQFDATVGNGVRMDGLRTCKYVFRQLKGARKP